MEPMKLSDALGMVKGNEKTASANTPATSARSTSPTNGGNDAGERLKKALKEATAPAELSKTANQASPVEDLTKLAAELSNAEHEALTKEAQLYGAAVCDGFMARAAQYQDANNKIAAAQPYNGDVQDFNKFAGENPALVKEAAELGYATTTNQLDKLAEAAYAKGWNDTVEQIHKTACDAFVSGFQETLQLLESAR
jgi:hypothetical protein